MRLDIRFRPGEKGVTLIGFYSQMTELLVRPWAWAVIQFLLFNGFRTFLADYEANHGVPYIASLPIYVKLYLIPSD